jgi:UDP-GlcNAc:undecaprenyl-phosphate GlcNAc-1-phosphate transferase
LQSASGRKKTDVTFFVQSLVACLLTALLIVWLRRPAQRFGLLDHAGGRKRHGDSIPLTGGVALTVGFVATLFFSAPVLQHYAVLFVAMGLLFAIGLLDDLGEVSPSGKLIVQLLAALFMTSWANHFLVNLGDLFDRGPFELRNWGIPLTVFATVAVINGFNMLDGIDGLAGGLAFCVLGFFAAFAGLLGDVTAVKLLVVLLGALAGFLLFNMPHPWRGKRRTFMGDTGSLILGFVVAWFSIDLTQRPGAHVPPVVMLWVVGIVLLDLFTVTLRRVLRRRDPALPDRGHIHHLLLRRGYSGPQCLIGLLSANLLLGAAGTALWRLGYPEYVSLAGFMVIGAAYLGIFLFPARLWRLLPRLRRDMEPQPRPEETARAPDEPDRTSADAPAIAPSIATAPAGAAAAATARAAPPPAIPPAAPTAGAHVRPLTRWGGE